MGVCTESNIAAAGAAARNLCEDGCGECEGQTQGGNGHNRLLRLHARPLQLPSRLLEAAESSLLRALRGLTLGCMVLIELLLLGADCRQPVLTRTAAFLRLLGLRTVEIAARRDEAGSSSSADRISGTANSINNDFLPFLESGMEATFRVMLMHSHA